MRNKQFIGFYTIVRREVMRIIRIWPQTLLPPVITVSLYFVIFGNLIGEKIGTMGDVSYIQYIVPGLIMLSIITNSYANVVASFFGAKFQRHIEEMLVSPMNKSTILWGFILGGVVRGLIIGLMVTIISLFFTEWYIFNISLTLLVAILTAVLFSLAGFVNAVYAKKFDDISIVPTFVLAPLTYLGGIFYSIDLLSPLWQQITHFNPIFYMVNAFRFGMLGSSDVHILSALGVILGFIVSLLVFCLWLLHKGIGVRN